MTEMAPEEIVSESIGVEITTYPSDAPEKALRQIGLGITPLILLEVDMDEETEEMTYKFIGSCIDTPRELLETAQSMLAILESAVEQAEANADV